MQWVGLFMIVLGIMLLFAAITSNVSNSAAALTIPSILAPKKGSG